MVVLNVCEIDPPTGVSAPLKPISCEPSTGATPYAGPFRHEIRPVLPTAQPVSSVKPAGKSTLAPGASAGESKLPLLNGATYVSKAAVKRDNPSRKENPPTRTFFINSLQRATFSPSAS